MIALGHIVTMFFRFENTMTSSIKYQWSSAQRRLGFTFDGTGRAQSNGRMKIESDSMLKKELYIAQLLHVNEVI